MNRLQRYVLRELIWPLVGSLFFFTLLLLITRLFRLIDILLQTDIRASLLLHLLWMLTLSVVSMTVPMAALLATMVGFGRMASEHEMLAVRAGGISLWQVFRPVLWGAAALTMFLIVLNSWFMPSVFRQSVLLLEDIRFEAITNLQPQIIYQDPNLPLGDYDLTLFYEKREDKTTAEGIRVLGMRDVAMKLVAGNSEDLDKRETLVYARRGAIVGNRETKELSVLLEEGTLMPINHDNPAESTLVSFDHLEKALPTIPISLRAGDTARTMTVEDLIARLSVPPEGSKYRPDSKRLRGVWREYYRFANELIFRFSMPFACLAFVAIAMPLAVVVRRGQKSVAFLLTFGLMFFYYIIFDYGQALGEQGSRVGWVMIVAPNFILGVLGIWLMRRSARQ